MNTVQLIAAFLAAIGGLGGLAASLRARAQNALDDSNSAKAKAEAESIAVDTARDLIAQVREEMERRVGELSREVSRLEGRLEGALEQRDRFRDENRELRERVAGLERRVEDLTEALTLERERRQALEAEASQPEA